MLGGFTGRDIAKVADGAGCLKAVACLQAIATQQLAAEFAHFSAKTESVPKLDDLVTSRLSSDSFENRVASSSGKHSMNLGRALVHRGDCEDAVIGIQPRLEIA